MQLINVLTLALPALAAVAQPRNAEPSDEVKHLEERAKLPRFHLKTKVHGTQGGAKDRFDGLWVSSYHTGAGLNDVVLSDKGKGLPMILNDTRLAMIWDESAKPGFGYFGVELEYDATYAAWEPVTANIGFGKKGFKFEDNKLVGGAKGGLSGEWKGWRVCDWWHEIPQLFWNVESYNAPVTPGCANVDLIRVPVKAN
jgi:hypothetical protein